MSYESRGGLCLPHTVLQRTTECRSYSIFGEVDPILSYDIFDRIEESCFLITIQVKSIVVPYHRYSCGSCIVPVDMGSFGIVPSCPSLIDLSSLSDYIIVSDISPSLCLGMVEIYGSDEGLIIRIFIESFRSMMQDDAIDLTRFFDRPEELIGSFESFQRVHLRSIRNSGIYMIEFYFPLDSSCSL
jgi:hypothetical protein